MYRMKIIDLKNALVAGASCYSTLHFLEEGRKLKISFIAGVLSASVISLKNDNTENNIMFNQDGTPTPNQTAQAASIGILTAIAASALSSEKTTSTDGSTTGSTIFALVTGYYTGAMTFFNSNTNSTITLKAPVEGSQDVFIAKIDANGTWIWAVDAGSSSTDQGYSITALR